MSHRCPAPGCTKDVPSNQYACRDHWFSIPKPLRDELWHAYREHGQLSEPHIAAMEACDNFLMDNAV
jgi:hypothetical protein